MSPRLQAQPSPPPPPTSGISSSSSHWQQQQEQQQQQQQQYRSLSPSDATIPPSLSMSVREAGSSSSSGGILSAGPGGRSSELDGSSDDETGARKGSVASRTSLQSTGTTSSQRSHRRGLTDTVQLLGPGAVEDRRREQEQEMQRQASRE